MIGILALAAGELDATNTGELAKSVQAAYNGAIIQWALRGSEPFDGWLERVLAPLLGPAKPPRRRSTKKGQR